MPRSRSGLAVCQLLRSGAILQSMKRHLPYFFGLFLCLACFATFGGCAPKMQKDAPGQGAWRSDPQADAALQEGRLEEAIQGYLELVSRDPENALAQYYLGYALGMTGDHQAEVLQYEKAEALGYAESDFYYNMGMAYGELGELEQSLQAFDAAVELAPDSAENRFGQALALENMGEEQAARDALEKAVQLAPDHVRARFALARLLLRKGDTDAARRQLQAVLEHDPGNPVARQLLREIDSSAQ